MLVFPKRIQPTRQRDPGLCPCRRNAAYALWEADLALCVSHGHDYLASEEKKIAVEALEIGDDAAALVAIDRFVDRIWQAPGFFTRLRRALAAWRGA